MIDGEGIGDQSTWAGSLDSNDVDSSLSLAIEVDETERTTKTRPSPSQADQAKQQPALLYFVGSDHTPRGIFDV